MISFDESVQMGHLIHDCITDFYNTSDFEDVFDIDTSEFQRRGFCSSVKGLGFKEATQFETFDGLMHSFVPFLHEQGVELDFLDIYIEADSEEDLLDDGSFKSLLDEYLEQNKLGDTEKKIVRETLVGLRINHPYITADEFDDDYKLTFRSDPFFISVKVDKNLIDEQLDGYLTDLPPSVFCWYVAQEETRDSVTYMYMGPSVDIWNEFGHDSIYNMNLFYFLPLLLKKTAVA